MIINEKLFSIPQGHSRHSSPPLSGIVSVLEIKLGDMNWEVSVCEGQEGRSGIAHFERSFF